MPKPTKEEYKCANDSLRIHYDENIIRMRTLVQGKPLIERVPLTLLSFVQDRYVDWYNPRRKDDYDTLERLMNDYEIMRVHDIHNPTKSRAFGMLTDEQRSIIFRDFISLLR